MRKRTLGLATSSGVPFLTISGWIKNKRKALQSKVWIFITIIITIIIIIIIYSWRNSPESFSKRFIRDWNFLLNHCFYSASWRDQGLIKRPGIIGFSWIYGLTEPHRGISSFLNLQNVSVAVKNNLMVSVLDRTSGIDQSLGEQPWNKLLLAEASWKDLFCDLASRLDRLD